MKEPRLGRLAAAVILQAVDDLSKVGSPLQRQAARDWFAGKREDGLSFELCCKLLDRNTEDTRRKLEARYSRAFSTDPLVGKIEQEGDSSPLSR
jgi:hypothetical protein